MSNNLIKIFVPGQPKGQERARSTLIKGKSGKSFISHYTPTQTRNFQGLIGSYGVGAMRGRAPTVKPVHLQVLASFEIPKSWPVWKKELAMIGHILPTTKPDSDNILKLIKDGLNKIVWVDDCCVVDTQIAKKYSDSPGVLVVVTELEQFHHNITRNEVKQRELEVIKNASS